MSVTLVAAPEFFTATLMVLLFVLALGIGKAVVIGGIEGMGVFELIQHFALPIAALCFVIASQMIRMSRAAVLNVMSSPLHRDGDPEGRAAAAESSRAMPLLNSIGPIANVVAINLAYLVTGVIVIEVYFAYPGLATLNRPGCADP